MAKAPSGVENLDFEHLGDQELREVMQRAKDALAARFTSRIQEFREAARVAGFAVTLTKLGKETSRRAHGTRRKMTDAAASARNTATQITTQRHGQVVAGNPDGIRIR